MQDRGSLRTGLRTTGLELRNTPQQTARLCNSEILVSLPSLLLHLDEEQKADVVALIRSSPSIFKDVPARTTVLEHDVDVGGAAPI